MREFQKGVKRKKCDSLMDRINGFITGNTSYEAHLTKDQLAEMNSIINNPQYQK